MYWSTSRACSFASRNGIDAPLSSLSRTRDKVTCFHTVELDGCAALPPRLGFFCSFLEERRERVAQRGFVRGLGIGCGAFTIARERLGRFLVAAPGGLTDPLAVPVVVRAPPQSTALVEPHPKTSAA